MLITKRGLRLIQGQLYRVQVTTKYRNKLQWKLLRYLGERVFEDIGMYDDQIRLTLKDIETAREAPPEDARLLHILSQKLDETEAAYKKVEEDFDAFCSAEPKEHE